MWNELCRMENVSPFPTVQGDDEDDYKNDKMAARNLDSGIDLGSSS